MKKVITALVGVTAVVAATVVVGIAAAQTLIDLGANLGVLLGQHPQRLADSLVTGVQEVAQVFDHALGIGHEEPPLLDSGSLSPDDRLFLLHAQFK